MWLKELKTLFHIPYVISELNVEKFIGTFYEKELQKTNQKEFRTEKEIKKKGNRLYLKYFPKPYEAFRGEINVKVDLSNHPTKADLKNAAGVYTSNFAKKKLI